MRRQRHIYPEELMNPDLLSEILIIGSVLLVVVLVLLTMLQALDLRSAVL